MKIYTNVDLYLDTIRTIAYTNNHEYRSLAYIPSQYPLFPIIGTLHLARVYTLPLPINMANLLVLGGHQLIF